MSAGASVPIERLRAIHAMVTAGDFAGAALAARHEIDEGREHPFLLNLAAAQREQQGDLEGALQLLHRAYALAPEDIGVRNALGLCLRRLDRPHEAVPHLRWVVSHAPDAAFAHASLGDVLQMIGALAEADACYVAALQRDPAHPIALAGRATVACLRGDAAAARRFGEAALTRMPNLPDAVIALSTGELQDGQHESAAMRLRELISSTEVSPPDRARALGVLGDVLDGSLQPHLAFIAYQECNSILHDLHRARYASGQSARDYAVQLARYVGESASHEWPEAMPADAGSQAQHVFLIGFPRSGTTLLEVILEGHPDIVTLEERELLIDSALRYMADPTDLSALANASEAELQAFRDAYWNAVRSCGVDPAGKMFVDKYPLNILKIPLIARLFPNAKILLARRDPRDVVLSCFRRRFQMSPPFYELLTLDGGARYYDAVMRVEQACLAAFHLHPHIVSHERLLDDFGGEMQSICRYLNIEWTDKMGEFAERARKRPSATPSTAQLTVGLNRRSLGHWRRYAAELDSVMPVLAPWVAAFGYE